MDTTLNQDFTKEISGIVSRGRSRAKSVLKDELIDCITEICDYFRKFIRETGEVPAPEKGIAGFTLEQIQTFVGLCAPEGDFSFNDILDLVLESPVEQTDDLILRFMDFREMNRAGVRARYPNTFRKWTPEDDDDLRSAYGQSDPDAVNWTDLSHRFGRPVNALKIRLEHLGFTLSEALLTGLPSTTVTR